MLFSGKREGSGQHGLVSKHTGEWMREGISQSSLGELNLSILTAKEKYRKKDKEVKAST